MRFIGSGLSWYSNVSNGRTSPVSKVGGQRVRDHVSLVSDATDFLRFFLLDFSPIGSSSAAIFCFEQWFVNYGDQEPEEV